MRAIYKMTLCLILMSLSQLCCSVSPKAGGTAPSNQTSPDISKAPTSADSNQPPGQERPPDCKNIELPCEIYWRASDVFIGKVVEIRPIDKSRSEAPMPENQVRPYPVSKVRFQVEKIYRGAKEALIEIDNLADKEGRRYNFILGERYLVSTDIRYENGLETRRVIDSCSPTKLVSLATEEINYVEDESRKYPDGRFPEIPISGGFIQGRAISLPKPIYPREAKEAKVAGQVRVLLAVDEEGKAIKAKAVCGHPLLKDAAEKAAMQVQYAPMLLSGKPVKVSGVIVYNFQL